MRWRDGTNGLKSPGLLCRSPAGAGPGLEVGDRAREGGAELEGVERLQRVPQVDRQRARLWEGKEQRGMQNSWAPSRQRPESWRITAEASRKS